MTPQLFALRLLLIITDTGTDKRINQLFTDAEQPIYYQFRAQGTAKTEILDICGLDGSTRVITAALIPKMKVEDIFGKLEETFDIRKKGNGVALTLPITGIQASMLNLLSEEQKKEAKAHIERKVQQMINETSYAMIMVAVREGYSDDVIDAATKAGANGGSVIRGRRRGSEAVVQFFGISMQEEQEFVMIIVPREKKSFIMNAISSACGLQSDAHGIIFSVPVDEVLGIHEP
nr:transcriptional regulator [uncultured Sellimonas sp.]